MRRAVIDVGSNSVLLVVAELHGETWRYLHEGTAVTALGEGTKQTGLLSSDAIARTLLALKEMFAKASELGAEDVRAGATMAARIATNAEVFLAQAEAQNTPVFILSGEREAELGFQSVAQDPSFADAERLSIIDPGGHSTEIVTATRGTGFQPVIWQTLFKRSFPIGTLALRSGTLSNESPTSPEILRACEMLDESIGLCYRPNECGKVVVLGATGTNLVSIRDRLLEWDPMKVHGARLDYEEVSRAVGWLSSLTDAERAAVPGMELGREKTIHLGALILERFLFAFRAHDCFVSIRGWRHAVLETDDEELE